MPGRVLAAGGTEAVTDWWCQCRKHVDMQRLRVVVCPASTPAGMLTTVRSYLRGQLRIGSRRELGNAAGGGQSG